MKRTLQVLSALLAILMLCTACGSPAATEQPAAKTTEEVAVTTETGTEEAPAPEKGGTLRVVLNEENTCLNPLWSSPSKCDITVARNVYETLTVWDYETGETVPGLAEEWEWIDDLHLRLRLREGITTAAGTPITADDVVWSWQQACTVGSNAPSYGALFDPNECYAEDELTVVLGTLYPYPTLADMLPAAYFVLSQSEVEAAGGLEAAARNCAGSTGPYVFKEWADGQYLTIEKNENYWGGDVGYYDEIMFTFVPDNASRAMAVQSGDADIAFSLQAAQIAALEADSNTEVEVFETNGLSVFYMNTNEGPLANEKVRQAIAKLVDYEAVNALTNYGYGQLPDSHIPYKSSYYSPTGVTFARDVEGAKALLAEAGYEDGLDINIFGFSYNSDLLELIQANLAEGGINITIELTEVVAGLDRMMSGDYELYIGASSGEDVARCLKMVDGRNEPIMTFGGSLTKDEALYDLVDAGLNEFDDEARHAAYGELATYVAEHALVIPLTCSLMITAKTAGLEGIGYDAWGDLILYNVHPAA